MASKRFTGTLLLLVLLFTACVKQEDLGGPGRRIPVGFSSYAARPVATHAVSRADDSFVPVGSTTLPSGSRFGVFAFYQEGVVGSSTARWAQGGWHPSFMFNQQVDYNGTSYPYNPPRYWPSNEENTLTFWAYYPYSAYSALNTGALKLYESDGSTPYSPTSTGLPKASYTVNSNPAAQSDLLFDSFAQKDKTYDNCMPVPGTVPLLFRHALALVEFRIAEGEGAVINSFEISNIYWSGVCADPSANPLVWGNWSNSGSFNMSSVEVNDGRICMLLMMPQTLQATAGITINYDISYPSFDPGHPDPIIYAGNQGSILFNTTALTAWQAGKHYVYRISAGYERIEFEEAVELSDDWAVGNGNISVPE